MAPLHGALPVRPKPLIGDQATAEALASIEAQASAQSAGNTGATPPTADAAVDAVPYDTGYGGWTPSTEAQLANVRRLLSKPPPLVKPMRMPDPDLVYLFAPAAPAPEDTALVASFRYDPTLPCPGWEPQAHIFSSRTQNHVWVKRLAPLYMVRYHLERLAGAAAQLGWEEASCAMEGDYNRSYILSHILVAALGGTGGRQPVEVRLMLSKDASIKFAAGPYALPRVPRPLLLPFTFFQPGRLPEYAHTWGFVVVAAVVVEPSDATRLGTSQRSAHDLIREHFELAECPGTKEEAVPDPEATPKAETFAKAHGPPSPVSAFTIDSTSVATDAVDILYLDQDMCVAGGTRTTPYFWLEDPVRDHSGRWVTPPRKSECHGSATRRYALDGDMCREEPVPWKDLRDGDQVWLSNDVRGWGWGVIRLAEWDEPQKSREAAAAASSRD